MKKPIAFANALTTVVLSAYLVCAALVYIAPDFVFSIAQSWFHGWNLDIVRATTAPSFISVALGAVSLGIYIWVLSYIFTRLYNHFSSH